MNVAIIGCGGMGPLHAQMAANCGHRIVACADQVKKAATALAKQHGAKAYTEAEAAINHGEVEIAAICTPTPTHADMVKLAAKAKKHIFCEKPFCRTPAQCRQAVAAAEKAGVKLFVGHVVRYFHEFEAMKAQVEAGKVGKPGYIKMYRGGLFPGGSKNWFHDYEQSGGVTLDSMIHDLDWLLYMFGEPQEIFCQALQRTEPRLMDYAQATLRMKSGLIAKVIGTWAHPSGFRVKVEICGDNGMIDFDSAESSLTGQKCETAAGPGMIVPMSAETVSPYQLEWEDFTGWLEGRQKPRVTPADAMRSVEIALAALKSAKTRKPVKL
jgi:UDP-N-acetylglucosamine 3-dehydrogenase